MVFAIEIFTLKAVMIINILEFEGVNLKKRILFRLIGMQIEFIMGSK